MHDWLILSENKYINMSAYRSFIVGDSGGDYIGLLKSPDAEGCWEHRFNRQESEAIHYYLNVRGFNVPPLPAPRPVSGGRRLRTGEDMARAGKDRRDE